MLPLFAAPEHARAETTITYSTPGAYEFEVPAYETLTIKVWGGGAGGYYTEDTSGGQSRFGSVIANGGYYTVGGTAEGGDINTAGSDGASGTSCSSGCYSGGKGGDSPNGGTGGTGATNYTSDGSPGSAPGAGGGGAGYRISISYTGTSNRGNTAGGGAGGYAEKTYTSEDPTVGGTVTVVVGAGGAGETPITAGGDGYSIASQNGGDGADGRVEITYTPNLGPAAPTLYDDGASQIAFNNARMNDTSPTFRTSALYDDGEGGENFDRFQIQLATTTDFSSTIYAQTFSGTYASGTPYNLTADSLSPSLPTDDDTTYYVRVRGSGDGGSTWGNWSIGTWSYTYTSSEQDTDWYQTTGPQFGAGTLSSTAAATTSGVQILQASPGTYTGASFDAGASGNTDPFGITWDGTYFWVLDRAAGKVYRHNADGTYADFSFNTAAVNAHAYDITWDGSYFWIVDYGDAEVYRYNADGTYSSFSFDTAGSGNEYPYDITWDGTYFWVTDISNDEVYRYNSDGTYSSFSFDIAASGNESPGGITWDGTYFWVVDSADTAVYRYNSDGTYSDFTFETYVGNSAPFGITWDGTFFWVLDYSANEVYKYIGGDLLQATTTSTAIDFDLVPSASGWDQVSVGADTTTGSTTVQVLGADEQPLSGYSCSMSDSDTSCTIDISGLDPQGTANHQKLYLRATLENVGGSPTLDSWSMSWANAAPTAPTLYNNDSGSDQIAFNNSRQNDASPTFRVSSTYSSTFDRFQIQLATTTDFSSTIYAQTFSGTYASGTPYNLTADALSPSLPTNDDTTYYVRVRASADGGSTWGSWSAENQPAWSYTYTTTDQEPDWYQTTTDQFETGILSMSTATTTGAIGVTASEGGDEETQTYSTPGSYDFEVPAYETLTVKVWGGGAGAYGAPTFTAENGDQSSFNGSVVANGGIASSTAPGPGGTASGGDTNTTGGDGETSTSAPSPGGDFSGGEGGDAPNGGAGGLSGTSAGDAGNDGSAPGGGAGGGGFTVQCFTIDAVGALYGGGAGGYSEKTYSPGDLTPGSSVSAFVGAGGAGADGADQSSDFCSPIIYGDGGNGANGRVEIAYTPLPEGTATATSTAIAFDFVPDASGWDQVSVTGDTTNGTVTVQVLGADQTELSGYACSMNGGESSCSIDLSGLDPEDIANHATIYLRATLEYDDGSPTLESWSLSWETESKPDVATDNASSVTATTAILNGTLTNTGGEIGAGTQHGFLWGTDESLSGGDTATTTIGNYLTTGAFTRTLTGLMSDTIYYIRAYAANTYGSAYGTIKSFTTRINPSGGSFIGSFSASSAGVVSGGSKSGGEDEIIGSEIDFEAPAAYASVDGSDPWTDGANAYASDGARVTASASAATDYHTFDFDIPGTDEITGIAVKLEASASQAGGTLAAELSWDGGASVTASGAITPALTTSDAVYTLGGASDTWGRSWSLSDLSDANFRVRVIANPDGNTVRLDALQVRVYHQATGGNGGGGGGEI